MKEALFAFDAASRANDVILARYVHRFADVNGQGEVTRDDLLRFVRDEGLFSDYEDGLRVRA